MESDGGRRLVLPTILLFTMTASSYQIFVFAVLAKDIIDDLAISRTGLGLLSSLNTMVGAVTAPATGRVTDRFGARRATVIVLLVSGAGMALMALSANPLMLAASAVIWGVPQGWGNPTTNALIAERVPARARGTITGIKQSGVQFGIFLAGFTLPALALALGWRGALWGYAVLFIVGAGAVALTLGPAPLDPTEGPSGATAGGSAATPRAPLPGFIWLLSAYALLYGTAGGAVSRFFPLWANEEVGQSTVVAGALVALGGLLGIAARIGASRLAQERIDPSRLLAILAATGASYCAVLLLTTTIGAWVLWPAAVLNAIGIAAWNAVAMLAIIVSVPRESSGRASGIVMLGFLTGLTIGSPMAGAIVDRWETYQPVWAVALILCLVSAAVIEPALRARVRGPGLTRAGA